MCLTPLLHQAACTMNDHDSNETATVIGWREWVALPQLGIKHIKPKIDTGARSSALHAFDVTEFTRAGKRWVRFKVCPLQRTRRGCVTAEAAVFEYRDVTTSSGHRERRPVILTEIEVLRQRFTIELTLANRDALGFRMLLGREAIRGRFIVDPGRSFLAGRRKRRVKRTRYRPRNK